jgi:Flp pilus assembly protein TadG
MTRRRNLGADRSGGIAILAGIGMTALIGMSAFAIDLGTAYAQRARLQKVADSAALAGAISWVKTGSGTAAQATVQDVVVANGWATSVIKTTLPPTSSAPKVTVSLAAPSTLTLARVLVSYTTVTTTGYSVASVVSSTTPACLVSLTTMQVNGTINVGNCAVAANSTSSSAINVNSSGNITASSIDTPGGIVANGKVSGTEKTGTPAAAANDPYKSDQTLEASAVSACTYVNYNNNTTAGCYQNANINGPVTLGAGTFVFSGLNVNGGGSITATSGTTIIVTSQFSPGGNITITAPVAGASSGIPGIAIYVAGSGGMNINSGVTYAINGAIYVPSGTLNLDGGSADSGCTYIVANMIASNGGSLVVPQTNCSSYNYTAPSVAGGSKIALIQ